MSAYNLFGLIFTWVDQHDDKAFVMCVTEIIADFLLDLFTIGVTLYLNLQAS